MDYKAWIASLGDSIADSGQRVGEQLPGILAATTLVLLGWLAAWLLRLATQRVTARVARLVSNRSIRNEIRSSGVETFAPKLVGAFAYWVVLLFFLAAAAEVVGLTVVTAGVSRLARYLPQLLAAALVVLVGLVLGNLTRRGVASAATSSGLAHGELVGRALRVVILLVAGIVALDQVGIDSRILDVLILIVAGTLLGGAALAFGLGARRVVGNLLAVHYLTQTYRTGQTIRVGGFEGRILEFTSTGVVLQTTEGQVLVPGDDFGRTATVLLGPGTRS